MKQLYMWIFLTLLVVLIVDPSGGDDRVRRNRRRRKKNRQRQHANQNVDYLYATVEVRPNPSIPTSNVTGVIHFRQKITGYRKWPTEYNVTLHGFNKTDDIKAHGSHIHTYGTISNGCEGAGGHYNPTNTEHGLPIAGYSERHIGDLENVVEDANGDSRAHKTNKLISLTGPYSILGRTWDVHVTVDNGNPPSGSAGRRLACGVVVVSDGSVWN